MFPLTLFVISSCIFASYENIEKVVKNKRDKGDLQ